MLNENNNGLSLLDDACEKISTQRVTEGMDSLLFGLLQIRDSLSDNEWQSYVTNTCRKHQLLKLVHESPFTSRAYHKPRGYPGDAVMMDYVYNTQETPLEHGSMLPSVYQYELNTPGCKSVRERRNIATMYIDSIASKIPNCRILSIACGHLREAASSVALVDGMIEEFYALDQDPRSLAVVQDTFSAYSAIKPVCKSVSAVLKKKVRYSDLDFIYSLGLYDYLNQRTGTRLLTTLFEMLNPGGRLLICNFAPNLYNIGYMEAFMDWQLIYRTETTMMELCQEIAPDKIRSAYTFRDSHKNLVFLELQKAEA